MASRVVRSRASASRSGGAAVGAQRAKVDRLVETMAVLTMRGSDARVPPRLLRDESLGAVYVGLQILLDDLAKLQAERESLSA